MGYFLSATSDLYFILEFSIYFLLKSVLLKTVGENLL